MALSFSPPTPRAMRRSTALGSRLSVSGFDINEHRRGAGAGDGRSRGEKAERRGDDRVARTDAGGLQGQPERVRAGGAADAVLGAHEGGGLALEGADLFAADEVLGGADAFDRGADLVANLRVLPPQIQHGNGETRTWFRVHGNRKV